MSEPLTPTEIDYWANAIRLGGDFSGSRVSDLVRLLEERSNARLRERIEKLEALVDAADRILLSPGGGVVDEYEELRDALGEVEREG